jgi:EmrB/QacA subfamily drug resistance transporter
MTDRGSNSNDLHKWSVLIAVATSSILVSLDLSILTTCLPQLATVFHTDSTVIGWLNIVYFIMTQSLMLTLAKVGDTRGRKKVYLAGVATYTIGLLVGCFSQSIVHLIIARVIQGAAGATINSLGLAITVATFRSEDRGKALGIILGSASIGLVVGPVLGGIILDLLGWRAVFYTRIPFMIVSLAMAWFFIDRDEASTAKKPRFDTRGAVSLFVWLSSLLLFLSFGNRWGLTAPRTLFIAAIAAIFFAMFIITERRSADPIVQLSIFKRRVCAGATVSSMVSTIGSSSCVFLVPFFLVQGLGYSATAVGAWMAVLAAPTLVLSPIAGRLSDRLGSRLLATAGVLTVCAGLIWFILVGTGGTHMGIAVGLILVGSGLGIFHPPNNSALVGSLPKSMLGVASAIGMTARQVGTSVSLAISGSIYGTHMVRYLARFEADGMDVHIAKRMAAVSGFRDALIVALCLASIGVFTSLFRGEAGEPEREQ